MNTDLFLVIFLAIPVGEGFVPSQGNACFISNSFVQIMDFLVFTLSIRCTECKMFRNILD